MEIKLDKTTKILLGLIAFGLFLNASNVWLERAYASGIQRVAICDENTYGYAKCAKVGNGKLYIEN